jgi:hypothetical protein
MRQKPLLLLVLSMLILQACLGAPNATETTVNGQTPEAIPTVPTPTPQPTALPSYLSQLRVAYILEGNIWVWDASTGARQLTSEGDAWRAKISDDGMVIVYQRYSVNSEGNPSEEEGASLWAINTDGSNQRLVVSIVQYAKTFALSGQYHYSFTNLYSFTFQPNSHWVYFNTTSDSGSYQEHSNDLHKVDVGAPTPTPLIDNRGREFTFSSDGRLISLASVSSIYVVNSEGKSLIPDTDGILTPAISFDILYDYPNDYRPHAVWLTNSTGLYTLIPSNDKFRFMYVSADGAINAQLAEFSAEWTDTGQPLISPDGTKVAYATKHDSTYELHVIDAATIDTVIASYENPPMFELYSWSPDSKRVVFFISDPLFPFAAGIGLPPAPLTDSAAPNSLRWLDADHFIFFREGRLLVGQVGSSQTFEIAAGFDKQMQMVNYYDFVLVPSP